MRVVTSSQAQEIEERIVNESELTLYDLMEMAGRSLFNEISSMIGESGHVVVVCGKGNNGGDGLVATRLLIEAGYKVDAFVLANAHAEEVKESDLTKEAGEALRNLIRVGGAKPLSYAALDDFKAALSKANVVIDAIFGVGLKGSIKALAESVIELINASGIRVVSADVPSGIDPSKGLLSGPHIMAERTVSFLAPKLSSYLFPAAAYFGRIRVDDFGLSAEMGEIFKIGLAQIFSKSEIRELLPTHPRDVHKASRGRVLIIAGSPGMTGAAVLATQAALKSGAGTVYLAAPKSICDILSVKLTEAIILATDETAEGGLAPSAKDALLERCSSVETVALGPGLSLDKKTASLVQALVSEIEKPMVLDADGISAMVGKLNLLKKRKSPLILTPHPGEIARLFCQEPAIIQNGRHGCVARFVEETEKVVLLKGPFSFIAAPDAVAINPTGNRGMATAGAGDVLTGMIAAFSAQGTKPYEATVLAAYIHGLAGDIAAGELTQYSLNATDIIKYLPNAIKEVLKGE
ncbi:MAG: NAD(P)H-hydrate dehydratase [Actinomycetota bacterium]|nr:NAD(P)H-hydrate dehydratase [Actinomycetota bacterium]